MGPSHRFRRPICRPQSLTPQHPRIDRPKARGVRTGGLQQSPRRYSRSHIRVKVQICQELPRPSFSRGKGAPDPRLAVLVRSGLRLASRVEPWSTSGPWGISRPCAGGQRRSCRRARRTAVAWSLAVGAPLASSCRSLSISLSFPCCLVLPWWWVVGCGLSSTEAGGRRAGVLGAPSSGGANLGTRRAIIDHSKSFVRDCRSCVYWVGHGPSLIFRTHGEHLPRLPCH